MRIIRYFYLILSLFIIISGLFSCNNSDKSDTPDAWTQLKNNTQLDVHISGYGIPVRQTISTMGWEDGIYISRDGLDLYCTYIPGDFLSWTIYSSDPTAFSPYLRGPDFGMDLVTNPVLADSWIQSDILYSHRSSISESFQSWTLSDLARPVMSEGGVCGMDKSSETYALFLYTSNDNDNGDNNEYRTHFRVMADADCNPSGIGSLPPAPLYDPDINMDNPHVERIDANTVVLFFESEKDIYYSISTDNMSSWSAPSGVNTINTSGEEIQPHLYYDNTDNSWYLYFAAINPSDNKLGIFRSRQQTALDWDSWGIRELVIGAGNTAGIGEPTLTNNGDISFVVVYEKPDGGDYDKYDADPWIVYKQ